MRTLIKKLEDLGHSVPFQDHLVGVFWIQIGMVFVSSTTGAIVIRTPSENRSFLTEDEAIAYIEEHSDPVQKNYMHELYKKQS